MAHLDLDLIDKELSSPATCATNDSTASLREPRISISSASSLDSHSSVPHSLPPTISSLHPEGDADRLSRQSSRLSIAAPGERLGRLPTGRNVATNATSDPDFEIDFEDGDQGNAKNWPMWRKCLCIFFISYSTMTV